MISNHLINFLPINLFICILNLILFLFFFISIFETLKQITCIEEIITALIIVTKRIVHIDLSLLLSKITALSCVRMEKAWLIEGLRSLDMR